jgi:hypothetical protein
VTGALPRAIERVVIVVFDGLRPDLVRPDTMPHLHRFGERGASFVEARSVFPSVTRVCSSAIATGAPPAVYGIVGNAFWHSKVAQDRPLDLATIEGFQSFARAGEPALTAPTFADVLATAGRRLAIVHGHGGTPGGHLRPRASCRRESALGLVGAWAGGEPHARCGARHARAVRPGARAAHAAARGG